MSSSRPDANDRDYGVSRVPGRRFGFLSFGNPPYCGGATEVTAMQLGSGTLWPHPEDILGAPDFWPLTLGAGGSVTIRLDHPAENRDGPDFFVWENGVFASDIDENYRVEASENGTQFFDLGTSQGGSQGFDLAAGGLGVARFVRNTDLAPTEAAAAGMAGADIDAIEIIHCATSVAARPTLGPVGRTEIRLVQPNPARESQTLEVLLSRDEMPRTLAIYAVNGRRVWSRDLSRLSPGVHRFVWDGRDQSGRRVASSVYYARLETGARRVVRRLVRVN